MFHPADFRATHDRIALHLAPTRILPAPSLGPAVYFKMEHEQPTGSFKVRGAFSKLTALSDAERGRGLYAASTGNHGLAVAHAAAALGLTPTIFLPEHASPLKIERLREAGAALRFVGTDCLEAEQAARAEAEAVGGVYLSPYNDRDVILGQGTLGVELLEALPELEAVFVAVGGGGLAAGVGTYLKGVKPGIEVVGASPAHSSVLHDSLRAGHVVDDPGLETLSDATAGGIEDGSLTLALCDAAIDRWELVSEAEIAAAMRLLHSDYGLTVEGAAGVAVAAFLRRQTYYAGRTTALVLCGGNVAPDVFEAVLHEEHS